MTLPRGGNPHGRSEVFHLKVCGGLLGRLQGEGVAPGKAWRGGAEVAVSRGGAGLPCPPAAAVLQETLSQVSPLTIDKHQLNML